MVFQITVVINHELQREILGFGDGIRVLYPASLVRFMKSKFVRAVSCTLRISKGSPVSGYPYPLLPSLSSANNLSEN